MLSTGDQNSAYFSIAVGILQAAAILGASCFLLWPRVRHNILRRTARSVLILCVHAVGFFSVSLYTAVHFILEHEGVDCTYLTVNGYHGLTFFPVYNITYAFIVGPYMVDCFRTWMVYRYSYAAHLITNNEEDFRKNVFVRYIYLAKGKWNVLWLSLLAILPFAVSAIAGGVKDTCEFLWWVHAFPFAVYITGFVFVAIMLRKIVDGFGLRREYVITGVTFIVAFLLTMIWTKLGSKDADGYAYHIHNRFWIYLVTGVGGFLRVIWPIWKTVRWEDDASSDSFSASSMSERDTEFTEDEQTQASAVEEGVEAASTTATRGPLRMRIRDLEWLEKKLDIEKVRDAIDPFIRMKLLSAHMTMYANLLDWKKKLDAGTPSATALWFVWLKFLKPDSYCEVQILDIEEDPKHRQIWADLQTFEQDFTGVEIGGDNGAVDRVWNVERVLEMFAVFKHELLLVIQDVMLHESDKSLLVGLSSGEKVELQVLGKRDSAIDLKTSSAEAV